MSTYRHLAAYLSTPSGIQILYAQQSITEFVHRFSLEAAVEQFETTSFGSTAKEFGMSLAKWRLPMSGWWEPQFDNATMPDVGAANNGRPVVVQIFQQHQDSGVKYEWDKGYIRQAVISGQSPDAIRWDQELILSGAPTRTPLNVAAPTFAPTTTNLIHDFKADPQVYLFENEAGTDPVDATGDSVLSWEDRITGDLLIEYDASSFGTYQISNGYDSVEFSQDGKYRNEPDDIDGTAGARTYILAVSCNGTFNGYLWQHSATAQLASSFEPASGVAGNEPQLNFGSGTNRRWDNTNALTDGAIHIVTLTFPTYDTSGIQSAVLRVDGSQISVDQTNTNLISNWNELHLGGDNTTGNRFDGNVHRMLIYDAVLSAADIDSNESGLATEYGVTL